MKQKPEGNAVVYCEGAFGTPNGKTAHGLVRFTRRYNVVSVLDSRHAGADAGMVLDGKASGIPLQASLEEALATGEAKGTPLTHLVVGLAPDGGRLPGQAREVVGMAIQAGLHIDSGLHDFLSEDERLAALAADVGVELRDIRRPPHRDKLHFFSGKIEEVDSIKIAVLGADSAIGKRTTAWLLVAALERAGWSAELIGTGQTAWLQGARYGLVLDSLVNDFVAGEIEHAVWSAWKEARPDVIILEGQGSLMNPAYPGGFELLAAGRPDMVLFQHAPMREEYDGFPGYRMHSLPQQIQAIQALCEVPVAGICINHEGMEASHIPVTCDTIARTVGVPTFDVLHEGAEGLVMALMPQMEQLRTQKQQREA